MAESSTRIKGTALSLKFGTPAVDYWCDVTAVTLVNEEGDSALTTFCDAASGGKRKFSLNITAVQSTEVDSLWRYIWEHAGETVAFTYAPHGNATPSADQPHFLGTAKIGPKPEIGGEAGIDQEFSFETTWEVVGTPVLEDGTP